MRRGRRARAAHRGVRRQRRRRRPGHRDTSLPLPRGGEARILGRLPLCRLPRQAEGLLPARRDGASSDACGRAEQPLRGEAPHPGDDPRRRHEHAHPHHLLRSGRKGALRLFRPDALGGYATHGRGQPARHCEPHRRDDRDRGRAPSGSRGLHRVRELRHQGGPARRQPLLLRDKHAPRPQQLLCDRRRQQRGPLAHGRPRVGPTPARRAHGGPGRVALHCGAQGHPARLHPRRRPASGGARAVRAWSRCRPAGLSG